MLKSQRDNDPWASKCSALERHMDSKVESEGDLSK